MKVGAINNPRGQLIFWAPCFLKFHYSWIRAENKTWLPDHHTCALLPKPSNLCQDLSPLGFCGRVLNIKINEGTFPAHKQEELTCTCLVMYSHTPKHTCPDPTALDCQIHVRVTERQGWPREPKPGWEKVHPHFTHGCIKRLSSVCSFKPVLHQLTRGEQTGWVWSKGWLGILRCWFLNEQVSTL